MQVKAWIENITIPTYEAGTPEKNPMFMEKRVYQGSSGVVYPHPVIEKIADEKKDKTYTAVYLENKYLKITILPEIGGRIQRAYDKVQKRDFIYYNQVIKPALVGLAGPWISGGIEFNWPQHHRPSTFSPVDFTIEENEDKSVTVWVNEWEVMFRTKGAAGFTLHPDKAYLEIKGRLFNPTPFPQSFLWWANPAVKVNEHYQSIFPPDVYAVFDHGKRDVSDFPIATGTYYKVNYAPGTDISRYANIPVPTSYMAIQSKYDFMGSYEHDTQAGMLHVANHHISPGKKQWTWGNGDFGFAWDRNLTDEDGPYIELMTGVFTDNQPDFTWLNPNEGKTFEQYFMPYAQIGVVKNATKEAMVSLEWADEIIYVKVYATALYGNAQIQLLYKEEEIKTFTATLSPEHIFTNTLLLEDKTIEDKWKVVVKNKEGEILVSWQPDNEADREPAKAAIAIKLPAEIELIEDLYLSGLHLEQYRHATYNAADYYEEGLRRSAGDIRCNNALGLLLMRRGQIEKAEPYFRKAIDTLTKRNPNPYDGEPYYNLGLSLFFQEKYDEAFPAFYKAAWNDAWQHNSYLFLARIAVRKMKYDEALELIEKSLVRNYNSPVARHIKAIVLRKMDKHNQAIAFIKESLQLDAFNTGCRFEEYLVSNEKGESILSELATLMRGDWQNYSELALLYIHAGLFIEAGKVVTYFIESTSSGTTMALYYKGWITSKKGNMEEAKASYKMAAQQNPAYVFPNKIEEISVLKDAISSSPGDGKALYYLGNLWYDKRQYPEAIECWEEAIEREPDYPTPYRNLSLAYYNKLDRKEEAVTLMEKAFALDESDARILMELDQLHKISGRNFTERLAFLQQYSHLINERDDLYLEVIILQNNLKNFGEAKRLLAARRFHPWEGGEGKVLGQFLLCHIELAKEAIESKDYEQAVELLSSIEIYPENLGEGKLYGTQENDIHYLMGCAYEGLGMQEKAISKFEAATIGISEPAQAIYYNDPQPDKIFYQALSWFKLDQPQRAAEIFERFIRFGQEHMSDHIRIDYFAVSLPDMLVFDIDLDKRNQVHCKYLIGLGYLGLSDYEKAKEYLQSVLHMDSNHQGAAVYLQMIPFLQQTLSTPLQTAL